MVGLRAESGLPQKLDLKQQRGQRRIVAALQHVQAVEQRFEDAGVGIALPRDRPDKIGHAGGRRHPRQVVAQAGKGIPDVRAGDAIERIPTLLEQIELAMDEGLERAAKPVPEPARSARHPAQLAEAERVEGDDPVRLPPLAAFQDDGGRLEQRHAI